MKATMVLGLIFLLDAAPAAAEEKPAAADSIQVTVVGTLRTGIFAIGGETTGTTITAKGITWELNLGKNAAFRKAAEKFNGKKVTVQGSLERRQGVEIKDRWIVTVTGLQGVVDRRIGGRGSPGLRATVGRKDSQVRFLSAGGSHVIDISSRFGIDRATIRRVTDSWPTTILVRLHLAGLESFSAGNGKIAVGWSVASTGNGASIVSLHKGGDDRPLDGKSPYHTPVRIVGGNGKIPLKNGYFEVPLPAKLFEGNPDQVTLRWIDFYRR